MSGPDEAPEEAFAAAARLILELRRRGIADLRILEAVEEIPRAAFAPAQWAAAASSGEAAPIACGQSMTPIAEIAVILEAAQIHADHHVLLLGLGAGYSAAIAARLGARIVAGDRFRTLVEQAAQALQGQAIANVECRQMDALADGAAPEGVGYDRIIAFGAFPSGPLPLSVMGALAPGGLIVAPVLTGAGGILARVTRTGTESWEQESMGPFYAPSFIPGLAREL